MPWHSFVFAAMRIAPFGSSPITTQCWNHRRSPILPTSFRQFLGAGSRQGFKFPATLYLGWAFSVRLRVTWDKSPASISASVIVPAVSPLRPLNDAPSDPSSSSLSASARSPSSTCTCAGICALDAATAADLDAALELNAAAKSSGGESGNVWVLDASCALTSPPKASGGATSTVPNLTLCVCFEGTTDCSRP